MNRDQGFILPPDMNDWLPKDHLARYIVSIVEQLDLSSICKRYSFKGRKGIHPSVLLSLLFYGYATGVFSSRKIERATYDSVAFRFISGNTHPDHDTIAHFRKEFLNELPSLFLSILTIAKEVGIVKVGTVSLDGTKIKANASKHKALSYLYASKLEEQLKTEVKELLAKGEVADNTDANDGLSVPLEVALREDKINVIHAAKKKIEQRAKERYEKEVNAYEEKIKAREEKEKRNGKKPKGKIPQPPQEIILDTEQINLTDEESRIMPLSGGGFGQCYNAQASVENDSRLMVHVHVTQNVNDKKEITPTLEYFNANKELKPENITADAGYFSKENIEQCTRNNITPYISIGKEQHNLPIEKRFSHSEPLKENATPIEQLHHRLQTNEGKKIYAKRKSTVEPVFGIIKQVLGFRQFLLRGFEKAKGEWNLVAIAYNLKRLHTLQTA